ncbi:lysosomal thioesterase PPT2-like [Nelusetta ayraudi]|uniref:lysosomal thioesterase PPT2-like n=1 Tax=Nelusetta ayraudi TaxID=303726 RepID=UPI003F70A1E3
MKSPRSSALQLLLLGLMALCINAYKPVIIVHGILDGPKDFTTLIRFITNAHSGTRVTVIDLYDYLDSLTPMWKQVDNIRKEIRKEMQVAPDGIHLLCFSQGGLICRAILATTPEHNIDTFISLSSPLAGQFGEPGYMKWLFPDIIKTNIFRACYNNLGQEVSICDYWKDPHQRPRYLESNNFLTLLNGEKPHRMLGAWRRNFLRIKKIVLIGGPDDGVITPWQSSQFGFYDVDEKVIDMINQDVYHNDTFGLKTLDHLGALVPCVVSGVKHVRWHSDITVFRTCIEEWLI